MRGESKCSWSWRTVFFCNSNRLKVQLLQDSSSASWPVWRWFAIRNFKARICWELLSHLSEWPLKWSSSLGLPCFFVCLWRTEWWPLWEAFSETQSSWNRISSAPLVQKQGLENYQWDQLLRRRNVLLLDPSEISSPAVKLNLYYVPHHLVIAVRITWLPRVSVTKLYLMFPLILEGLWLSHAWNCHKEASFLGLIHTWRVCT